MLVVGWNGPANNQLIKVAGRVIIAYLDVFYYSIVVDCSSFWLPISFSCSCVNHCSQGR